MKQSTDFSQEELEYVYNSCKGRMNCHPDCAEKYMKVIQNYPYLKTLDEAVNFAKSQSEKYMDNCQIWAKVGKDEEFYYIQDYYIVTNNIHIAIAAEYIGMEQIWY